MNNTRHKSIFYKVVLPFKIYIFDTEAIKQFISEHAANIWETFVYISITVFGTTGEKLTILFLDGIGFPAILDKTDNITLTQAIFVLRNPCILNKYLCTRSSRELIVLTD